MPNKVYVVTAGSYSDYRIEGVFLDPEKAKILALEHEQDYGSIEEYEILDDGFDASESYEEKIRWMYHFIFRAYDIKKEKRDWFLYNKKPVRIDGRLRQVKDTTDDIYIFLKKLDDDKAWKILHDKIAKRGAEEQLL